MSPADPTPQRSEAERTEVERTEVERMEVLHAPPAVRRGPVVGSVVLLAGLLTVIAGTFAPWVTSGGVDRDSYAITGIADRLGLAGDGFGATALGWWPFLGPIAMASLIAGILRWWRTCAWIAIIFGLSTGVIGGGVIAVAGGHAAVGITIAHAGPTITVAGAALAVLGGTAVLVVGRRWRHRRTSRSSRSVPPPSWSVEPVSMEPFGGPSRQSAQHAHEPQ